MEEMGKLFETIKFLIPNLESLASISSLGGGLGRGWLLGAFGTVAISLYGLSLGRTRAILSLLGIYVAFAFIQLFPYLEDFNRIIGRPVELHWLKTLIFLTAYAVAFFILNFSLIKRRLSSTEFSLFGVVLISLLQLGFIVSIILSFLPGSVGAAWLPTFHYFFDSRQALFFWAIAPLPVLLFIKRK